MESIELNLFLKADNEVGILQNELQAMEAKYRDSEKARTEMKCVVEEFEKIMGKMIGALMFTSTWKR